ncbi:MAG TPA: glycosyltransferase family 2 protein [Acidobacteriaceae bacterium]|nr:glycosyltransferase family 2 protein [Acidobacteriaceae bacterium]
MKVRMGEQSAGAGEISPQQGEGIAAVVVTYEPGPELIGNLKALRLQVERLIVVDNGSSAERREIVGVAADTMGIELIENGRNFGIAAALNRGVQRAMECGAEWVFLFDQDSRVTPGFVGAMLRAYRGSRWGERLKILTPQYRDAETGAVLPAVRAKEGIAIAWTSGSLLRVETLREFGLFREELFIDEVDHEYSLRLRRAGMVLDETEDATLLHALGSPARHRLLGREFCVTNYSPVRRYYQERNKVWMARHYGRSFPRFVLSRFRMSLSDVWKIVAFEEDKWRKLRHCARGIVDGLRGRMGKLEL